VGIPVNYAVTIAAEFPVNYAVIIAADKIFLCNIR
jgi:hypothetical protein